MDLVVIEAFGKREAVKKNFPFEVEVFSTGGHLFDLPSNVLGVTEEGAVFVPRFPHRIERLLKAAARAKNIFIAADPDREGEVIAWHIKKLLEQSGVGARLVRLRFYALSRQEFERALSESSEELDIPLVRAGLARRIVDRLIGYTFSIRLKDPRTGQTKVYPVGRVKSAVMRRLAALEKAEGTLPTIYRGKILFLHGGTGGEVATCSIKATPGVRLPPRGTGTFRAWRVRTSPVRPYNTARFLSRFASNIRNVASAARNAQRLYERGYITYVRTREEVYTEEAVRLAREMGFEPAFRPERPESGHEALRPAVPEDPDTLVVRGDISPSEFLVYQEIYQRFLEVCQSQAEFFIEGELEIGRQRFWLEAVTTREEAIRALSTWKFTSPVFFAFDEVPEERRLKETLLWMDRNRIGAPSTYADTLVDLWARNYVTSDLKMTKEGRTYVEFLKERVPWLMPETSSLFEELLEKVRQGKASAYEVFEALVDTASPTAPRIHQEERTQRLQNPLKKEKEILRAVKLRTPSGMLSL